MSKLVKAFMGLAALMALTALLPTSAFAKEVTLQEPIGTKIPVGTKLTATNTDIVSKLTDANGNVLAECTSVSLTGTLTKNEAAAVEVTVEKAEFKGTPNVTPHTTHCGSTFGAITVTTNPATNGLNWCLRSTSAFAADEAQVRGGGCAEASRPIRFVLDSSIAGECTYQRTAAVPGTFTTSPTAASMTVTKQEFPKVAGGVLCPERGFLDLTVSFYTDNAEEKPIFIVAGP